MEEFIIRFVTAVVTGKTDDLVVFGPPTVVNGQKVALEAWVPKAKGARKGSQVIGTPVIGVREGTELVKSYKDKDGNVKPLDTWKLRVTLSGDYSLHFEEPKTVSLAEFFGNS